MILDFLLLSICSVGFIHSLEIYTQYGTPLKTWRDNFRENTLDCVAMVFYLGLSIVFLLLISDLSWQTWESFTVAFHFSPISSHTGNPKGVMLTHGNVVADFSGFLKVTDVRGSRFPRQSSLDGGHSFLTTGRSSFISFCVWSSHHLTTSVPLPPSACLSVFLLLFPSLFYLTYLTCCVLPLSILFLINACSLPVILCRKWYAPTKTTALSPSCHWLTCLRDSSR